MHSLATRLDRLARAAGAEDSAGRLVAIIIHGDPHAIEWGSRSAVSLVVLWSESIGRGGVEAALAALAADRRALIRSQEKVTILPYPPDGEDPAPRAAGCAPPRRISEPRASTPRPRGP